MSDAPETTTPTATDSATVNDATVASPTNPLTVQNPANPSQTYTFGVRGKRPDWLIKGLADGSIKIPEGYKSAKDKAAEAQAAYQASRITTITIDERETAVAKVARKLRLATDKHAVAQRHLDEAKVALDALTAEHQTAVDALNVAKGLPAGVAVTPVEVPAATEAVTETAEIPAT
jgi:hypothetical protein